jgi:hypothetical protein
LSFGIQRYLKVMGLTILFMGVVIIRLMYTEDVLPNDVNIFLDAHVFLGPVRLYQG